MRKVTRRILAGLAGANECQVSDVLKDHVEALDRAVQLVLCRQPGWSPTDDQVQLMTDGEEEEMKAFFKTLPNGEELNAALSDCFSDLG